MDSESILKKYYKEINKFSHKGVNQEELVKKAKSGDAKSIDTLIKCNLKFVVSVAMDYSNNGVPLEDLINEGNFGLIKAIDKFDETRDIKFISYAVWWIRQSILKHLSDHSRTIRMPITAINKFKETNQTSPTECVSINNFFDGNEVTITGTSVIDTTSPYEENDRDTKLNAELKRVLGLLSKREREVMTLYYGLNGNDSLTLEAIGKIFGLTKVRVRQIRQNAIAKLRHNGEILVDLAKNV